MRQNFLMLSRCLRSWGWYTDSITKAVFLELLFRARWERGSYQGVDLDVGQCIFGRKELAERLGISERNVRTAIDHLTATKELTTQPTNRFTIATLCNYERWACLSDDDRPTERPAERPTTDH